MFIGWLTCIPAVLLPHSLCRSTTANAPANRQMPIASVVMWHFKKGKRMNEKFLLYIDILGFSELVIQHPEKVREIYNVVNKLNVHRHDAFQTIIFSDTILVYNKYETDSLHDKQYVVMYMIEFVQDLLFRGNLIDLNFRSIITYGEFEHFKLEHTECYYGKSLISAYRHEKEINGVGLFLDSKLEVYNEIYKSCRYNSELNFVFLFRTILSLKFFTDDQLPLPSSLIEPAFEFCWLEDEISILRKYFIALNQHENPRVRAKYLQTYQFYRKLMPYTFEQLEKENFSMKTINTEVDWEMQRGRHID